MVSGYPSLNGLMGFSTYEAVDSARISRVDSEVAIQTNQETRLSFGAAHANGQRGDREFVGAWAKA